MKELISQRADLHNQLVAQVNMDVSELAQKAEHMAECATDIRGHGYSCFINAREEFIRTLKLFESNYTLLCKPFAAK